MIKRFNSLLRRIVGSIKVNITALAATLGAIFLPIAVYLLIEGGVQDRPLAISLFILSMLSLILTMIMVYRDTKLDRIEKHEHNKVEYNRFELQSGILAEILGEVKRLNSRGKYAKRKQRKPTEPKNL